MGPTIQLLENPLRHSLQFCKERPKQGVLVPPVSRVFEHMDIPIGGRANNTIRPFSAVSTPRMGWNAMIYFFTA